MQGIGGIKAGKAFILIEAVDATGKILDKVRQRMGKFGTEISNIGKTLAMRAGAALLPIGLATKMGTAYDDIMRKVAARSDGTAAEMDLLRKQTIELGRAFGLMPTSMGKIQNIFAQAGFNRKEISQIGPAVATLARAGGEGVDTMMDADNAAKAVSAVLRGYSMDATQASDVTDMLAVALNASNFNLEDITTSLQYAVPAAAAFKVPLEEVLAVLGSMRDLQIDASIAGTAFRNMMLYMSQTKEQDAFNEKLTAMTGTAIKFKDAAGNLKGPMQILVAVMEATKDLGTAERSNLITQLLETRASVPGQAVGASTKRMADMLARLGNRGGFAQKIQKEMDSGLGGAFRRFMATVEELSIKIQTSLTPLLLGIADYINPILRATIDWIDKNRGLFASIIAGIAAVGAFGISLIVVGQSLRMAAGAMLFLTIPLRLLPTLLFGAAKAAILLINTALIPLINSTIRFGVSLVSFVVPALLRFTMMIISSTVSAITSMVSSIVSMLIPALMWLGSTLIAIGAEMFLAFGFAWPFMVAAGVTIAVITGKMLDLSRSTDKVATSSQGASAELSALHSEASFGIPLLETLASAWSSTFNSILDYVTSVGKSLYNRWSSTISSIANSLENGDITNAIKTLGLALQLEWEYAVQGLYDIWDKFILYFKVGSSEMGSSLFESFMKMENWLSNKMGGQDIFSEEYMQSFRATVEGTTKDTEDDIRDRMRSRRGQSGIAKLEKELGFQKTHSAIVADKARYDREHGPFDPNAGTNPLDTKAKEALITKQAMSLIGIGQINTSPKGALEAINAESLEGIKAFMEVQYESAKQDDETAKKSEEHLAAIRRRMEDAGVPLVEAP